MTFFEAQREQSLLRLGLWGPEKRGKTFTSLCLATHMIEYAKEHAYIHRNAEIALIDTEHGSSRKYARSKDGKRGFKFKMFNLTDYSPQAYIKAIKEADDNGFEILIVDQITHVWNEILNIHREIVEKKGAKYSYPAWKDPDLIHRAFIESYLGTEMHVICTMRAKVKHRMIDNAVNKIGIKPIQRDTTGYEFDAMGEMSYDAAGDHFVTFGGSRFQYVKHRKFVNPGKELAYAIMEELCEGEATTVAPAPELDSRLVADINKYQDILKMSDDELLKNVLMPRGCSRIEQLTETQANGIIKKMREYAQAEDRKAKRAAKLSYSEATETISDAGSAEENGDGEVEQAAAPDPSFPAQSISPAQRANPVDPPLPEVLTPEQMGEEFDRQMEASSERREELIDRAKDLAEGLGYEKEHWDRHLKQSFKLTDINEFATTGIESLIRELEYLESVKANTRDWNPDHIVFSSSDPVPIYKAPEPAKVKEPIGKPVSRPEPSKSAVQTRKDAPKKQPSKRK